ncbi:MAG: phosphodiesterase, partial [Pseudomonadota bacterium]
SNVMSFNPHAVAACQAHLPGVPVGLTTAAFDEADWGDLAPARRAELATLSDVTRLGAGFISHDRKSLDSPPVAALKTVGLPIFCWTIRSEAEEAEARRVADNITFEGYRPSH